MNDSERLTEVRKIITAWNFGPHSADVETLVAIWHVVGDNVQRENLMTDEPMTSEQPSGHLRWRTEDYGPFLGDAGPWPMPVLQQLFYITTYRGLEVSQTEEWRDVRFVGEP